MNLTLVLKKKANFFRVKFSKLGEISASIASLLPRPADNPVGAMARRLHLSSSHVAPRLSLPGKLVFPSSHTSGHFSMLGLGDIVMPGLLLCFVMRYDAYKKAQV
jgi:signal peptide peptidase-like protein 3